MKRYYILLLGLCMMSSIQAQDNDPRKAFDRFAQRSKQKFDDFRSRANEQYAEAMKRAWERFNAQPAVPRPKDETVPPVVLPEEDRDKPIETRPVPIKDVVTPPAPAPQPEPVSPVEERPQPKDQTVGFVYCGTKLEVRMNASSRPRLSSCDNDALAAAWSRLAKDDALNNTLRDCLDLRQELQLCDWAYLNMIHALAQKAFGESNEATLLTAYLYCQSGYQMRLARNSERVVLLFASNHAIYNSGYYRLENTNFYPFGGEEPLLEICDAKFPKEQPMSLLIPRAQQLAQQPSTPRTLTSKRYDDISVTTSVNKNMIDFYDSYPTSEVNDNFMTRWAMYGNTPLDDRVKAELYPALRAKIAGGGELEAANKLLNWVQTAFEYEYDEVVWGHDRAFFAEETLYYPYCDCEDRAILYTRLVRDLLGLKTILVYYPGHLACAVGFEGQVAGDYILLDGKRFVVPAPTYIGTSVGMTMPGMDNSQASVILLK